MDSKSSRERWAGEVAEANPVTAPVDTREPSERLESCESRCNEKYVALLAKRRLEKQATAAARAKRTLQVTWLAANGGQCRGSNDTRCAGQRSISQNEAVTAAEFCDWFSF